MLLIHAISQVSQFFGVVSPRAPQHNEVRSFALHVQAMDRCHRIGQQKPVLVLRLATAHSVEGKLLARARSKLALERLVIKKGGVLPEAVRAQLHRSSSLRGPVALESAGLAGAACGGSSSSQLSLWTAQNSLFLGMGVPGACQVFVTAFHTGLFGVDVIEHVTDGHASARYLTAASQARPCTQS